MCNRNSQRVCRVACFHIGTRQQKIDHMGDLRLIRGPRADDRFLDQSRGIFPDIKALRRRGQNTGSASLAQFQRAHCIVFHKSIFHPGFGRIKLRD